MAGLVPAIHDFLSCLGDAENKKSVDGRHKAGHDDIRVRQGLEKRFRYFV
jgi:hypothetical protein